MTGDDKFLTVEQVAVMLKLHPESVRRLVREGRLPAFKAGRSWRFVPSEIDAWRRREGSPRNRARILVVDDSEPIRDVIRITLEEEGYEVILAATGEGAMAALRKQLPDMVLLDLKMPNGSGVDVIREIRTKDSDLPVIIITGYPDSDLMHEALSHSPLMVISKPVNPDALASVVKKGLGGGGINWERLKD